MTSNSFLSDHHLQRTRTVIEGKEVLLMHYDAICMPTVKPLNAGIPYGHTGHGLVPFLRLAETFKSD